MHKQHVSLAEGKEEGKQGRKEGRKGLAVTGDHQIPK